jgi:3-oxoacyl-[acyl-carrier protein] reductase
MELKERIALVTGGASGMGKATCLTLAQRGCNIALIDLNLEEANRVSQQIKKMGREALVFKTDVANSKDVKKVVGEIENRLKKIDILVNNAGHGHSAFLEEITDDEWNRMIGVHLGGTFNFCRFVVPLMKREKGGKIINIASTFGMCGESQWTHYSAAKAGIIGFTKALAKELAPFKINVNAIAPGSIKTPLQDGVPAETLARLKEAIPWKRFGSPEEVASLIAFLCSGEAEYITGQVISINGGSHIVGI